MSKAEWMTDGPVRVICPASQTLANRSHGQQKVEAGQVPPPSLPNHGLCGDLGRARLGLWVTQQSPSESWAVSDEVYWGESYRLSF